MWQRFTERARKAVFYAQEEAQRFGEGYVSTEHLLLGLVREPHSVAMRVLEKLGANLSKVRNEIERQLPRGDARMGQEMQLTPRAKRVIDLAYDEARHLNNNYIGTEHLLLGLIREGEGLAGRVLSNLGVELEKARAVVIEIQTAEPRPDLDSPPNLSEQAKAGIKEIEEARKHLDALAQRLHAAGKGAAEASKTLIPVVGEAALNPSRLMEQLSSVTEPTLLEEGNELEKARLLALAQMDAKAQALNAERVLDFRFQYQLLETEEVSVLIVTAIGSAEVAENG